MVRDGAEVFYIFGIGVARYIAALATWLGGFLDGLRVGGHGLEYYVYQRALAS